MRKRHLLSALLPLLIIACGEDTSPVVEPPPSLTPDQQTVANVRAIRDVLEKYASEHDGTYGQWVVFVGTVGPTLTTVKNSYTGESEPSSTRAMSAGQIGIEWYFGCDPDVTAIGYRITGYSKDQVLITLESVDKVPSELRYQHDVTVANALLVLDVARQFAATDDGVFSVGTCNDHNNDGECLIHMLPNSALLFNPFSGDNTEPQDGLMLATPGAIGYLGQDVGGDDINSCTIEGYGCNGEIIVTIEPHTEYGEIVWGSAYWLRDAVEHFAMASGHYPHNLDVEMTPGNKTVMDIYAEITWDNAPDFVNPYTKQHYIPSIGIAAGKGEVAYQPSETSGVVTDYIVTGRGFSSELVRLGKRSPN